MEGFLPQSANEWISATSRDELGAANFVESSKVISMGPMPEKDSLILLRNRVAVDEPFEDDAKKLVWTLEYIPLGVTHAAAHLAVRAQTMNISTNLELFPQSDHNQANLLSNKEVRDIRRDATWGVEQPW